MSVRGLGSAMLWHFHVGSGDSHIGRDMGREEAGTVGKRWKAEMRRKREKLVMG